MDYSEAKYVSYAYNLGAKISATKRGRPSSRDCSLRRQERTTLDCEKKLCEQLSAAELL